MAELRTCVRCVMDESAQEISFDEEGVCSFCNYFDAKVKPILDEAVSGKGERLLQNIVEEIKRAGKGRKYNCVLGLSGGVDSSYLAYLAVQMGLRPLLIHVDTGWNTRKSEENIRKLVGGLGCDLKVETVDYAEMMDLQLAFYKASVKNCDIPQDHAFAAVLYRAAAEHGIKYILNGYNYATESILPSSWGFSPNDVTHLRAIHRRFGTIPLRRFPTLGLWHRHIYYPRLLGVKVVRVLNYVDYNKAAAVSELQQRFGWEAYGAKHYETIQTRFFQGYYLPVKFGIDKRKAHLSSLILSGQLSRESALEELASSPYPTEELLRDDMVHMAKKLGVTLEEWEEILASPPREHDEFPSEKRFVQSISRLRRTLGLRKETLIR